MISCGNCPYLDDCEENYECPFWEDDDYQMIKKAFDAVVNNEMCEDIGENLLIMLHYNIINSWHKKNLLNSSYIITIFIEVNQISTAY